MFGDKVLALLFRFQQMNEDWESRPTRLHGDLGECLKRKSVRSMGTEAGMNAAFRILPAPAEIDDVLRMLLPASEDLGPLGSFEDRRGDDGPQPDIDGGSRQILLEEIHIGIGRHAGLQHFYA